MLILIFPADNSEVCHSLQNHINVIRLHTYLIRLGYEIESDSTREWEFPKR